MSWLAPRLNKRVQITKPVQTPNSSSGGFDRSYTTLFTVWGELKPLGYVASSTQYIRGVQITDNVTHSIVVRKTGLSDIGRTFSNAFSVAFDSITDIRRLKSDFFLMVQEGLAVKGRIFRVHNISDNKEMGEYYNMQVEEIEEKGTGYAL